MQKHDYAKNKTKTSNYDVGVKKGHVREVTGDDRYITMILLNLLVPR